MDILDAEIEKMVRITNMVAVTLVYIKQSLPSSFGVDVRRQFL